MKMLKNPSDVNMVSNNSMNNSNQGVAASSPSPASTTPSNSSSQASNISDSSSGPPGSATGVARAMLHCRPNSHPFNDRTLSLEQSVKVGRSVARLRASTTNAIFDCKVLSRNHALIWYEAGKFYLQDTKSSNGTFVNNQRLSKGSEESLPREVCSGDIIQFGVDVMENSRKVTHGCIIATLKLFLPDGKEAKASPTIVNSTNNSALMSLSLPTQELYQLNQYIQEALAREQLLETKLAVLQRLVGQTESASNDAWKSLIDEDRLLTRVEILESQLSTYGKSMNEDKLREETKRLMEDKEQYQERAKDTLKRLVEEKLDAEKKLQDVETNLSNTEDEYAQLKLLYETNIEENRKLAAEVNRLTEDLKAANAAIPIAKEQNELETEALMSDKPPSDEDEVLVKPKDDDNAEEDELVEEEHEQKPKRALRDGDVSAQFTIVVNSNEENNSSENNPKSSSSSNLSLEAKDDAMNASTTTLNDVMEDNALYEADHKDSDERLSLLESQFNELSQNYDALKASHGAINTELNVAQQQLCDTIKLLDEKCRQLEDIHEVQKENSSSSSSNITKNSQNNDQNKQAADLTEKQLEEIAKLIEEKEKVCVENETLRAELASHLQVIEDYEQKQMEFSSTSTLIGSSIQVINPTNGNGNNEDGINTSNPQIEQSLTEAQAKISELLKVKEKFAEVSAENSSLSLNMSEMKEEMNLLTLQTKTATACALIPIAVVIFAIMMSYFPIF